MSGVSSSTAAATANVSALADQRVDANSRTNKPGLSDTTPPVADHDGGLSPNTPTLPPPGPLKDSADMLLAVLMLRVKTGAQQEKMSTEDIQANQKITKQQNDDIAKKLQDQLDKSAESQKMSPVLKALQWIGLALAIVVAAVTLNPVAIAGAAVAITMAVLNETGTMNKMTEAIAADLKKNGMSDSEAQKWAMVSTMMVGIGASLLSVGAGAASGVTSAAKNAVETAAKLGEMVSKVATAAKLASAATSITQAGVSVAKGVTDKAVADTSADVMDMKAFLAKLKAALDDETERLTTIVQQADEVVSKAIRVVGNVAESKSNAIRMMG